jgi:hypothetical protein
MRFCCNRCCTWCVQAPLSALAEDADLHVRELAFAARQYEVATAEQPDDYDALYNHGLVLQELSGKLQQASAEQAAMLRQVRRFSSEHNNSRQW